MPLIVAEKPSSTATNLKLRLIHDCRYINGFLNKIPFSMERLKTCSSHDHVIGSSPSISLAHIITL